MGFWDDFTGASARRDLERGRQRSRGELTAGRDAALADYGTAEGYFQPFAATGRSADDRWADLMGLNGPAAQAAAQAAVNTDPMFAAMGDRAVRGISRNVAASGLTGAGYRAGTEALLGNYNAFLDRLANRGAQGLQAAGGAASVRTGMGDLRFQTGAQLAGIETGAANARAASRSTAINNLLGVASLGVQAYTGMRFPGGTRTTGANLPTGYPGGMYP